MNLKDRLESIRKTNVASIKENDKDNFLFDIEDIFADSKELRTIITETIVSGKNIVFVSEPSIDGNIISQYFAYLLYQEVEDVIVTEKLTDEVLYSESKINIIQKPSIKDVVKILEYIMYGYKSFVFGMNFASLENVFNKIKAAIAVNYKNLSMDSIETILSSSNLVILYINKNIDGLFYISKIDKVVSENFITDVVTVIDFQQPKPVSKKLKKLKKSVEEKNVDIPETVIIEETVVEDVVDVQQENEIVQVSYEIEQQKQEIEEVEGVQESRETEATEETEEVHFIQSQVVEQTQDVVTDSEKAILDVKEEDVVQEQKEIISEISKKINKYKLLKEKVKNKRVDITE